MEILELEENGRVYFKEWLNACTDQEQRMAKPMIECLDVIGIKCKFVKEIEPKGLYELKSKSTGVRVYFFLDRDSAVLTNGTIKTYKTEYKFKQRSDIAIAFRLMVNYFNNK